MIKDAVSKNHGKIILILLQRQDDDKNPLPQNPQSTSCTRAFAAY